MDLISIEGYENAKVICLKNKNGELWVGMKEIGAGLGVKSISDLVLKEIPGTCEKKKLTKKKTQCYKMTEREFFKTFYDFDEDDLNTESNKNVFVKNNIMTNIINNCKGGKKRGVRSADGYRRKLFIPEYKIYESIEHKVKSKIGKIFLNEETLEEYSVKIYEIDPYFSEHYQKKYKLIKMVNNIYCLELILFFTKYCLAAEIDEKGHTDRDLEFE